MKHKLILWICGITLLSYRASAQSPVLPGTSFHGMVRDSASGSVLDGATISLLRLPDSALLRQTRSVRNGFVFRRVPPGRYLVMASYVGYGRGYLGLVSGGVDTMLQLASIRMTASTEKSMLEVVVRASIPPVVAKSDTLMYAASAFKTRPNASVEELLKKLPGVQVDKDGQVTVNGQKVDKFYIDGKEISVGSARALTRTLTSDMIAGVDAFDRQSDDARFTGVKDADGAKALNFRVKKAYQQSLTGKVYAGYGDQGSYGMGGNGFYLSPRTKAQLGVDRGNNNGLVTAQTGPPQAMGSGITTHTGVNFFGNTEPWRRATLDGNYQYSKDDSHNEQTERRQTFTGDSSLLLHRSSVSGSGGHIQRFTGHLRVALDSATELTVSPQLLSDRRHTIGSDSQDLRIVHATGEYLSNTAATHSDLVSDHWTAGGDVNLRHRFAKKGESFRLRLHGENQGVIEDKKFGSSTLVYDSAGALLSQVRLDQVSHQDAPTFTLGGSIGYTYPISKGLVIDGSYDINNRRQKSIKATYNYDSATGHYDRPDSLTTNRFNSSLLSHRFSVGLNRNSRKMSFQAGLAVQTNHQESHNFSGPGQDIDLRQLNWSPRAGLFYNMNKSNQLRFQYNGNSVGATIDQLQPLPDLSNPLLIRKGNPGLRPEFDHGIQLGYQHYSKDRLQSLMIQLSGILQENKFASNTTLLAGGVQELQYINSDGNYSGNFNITYNFAFAGGRKGNGQLGSGLSMNHMVSYTGGVRIIQSSLGWTPSASVNYSPLDRLLLEGKASVMVNRTNYSHGGMDLSQTNQQYTIGVSYDLPAGLLITSDLIAQVTGPQGNLPGQSQELWNATVSRRILPKKTLELRCSAYDLLDSNKGFSQGVGENYISTSNSLVLGRTVYMTVVYYFKTGLQHS